MPFRWNSTESAMLGQTMESCNSMLRRMLGEDMSEADKTALASSMTMTFTIMPDHIANEIRSQTSARGAVTSDGNGPLVDCLLHVLREGIEVVLIDRIIESQRYASAADGSQTQKELSCPLPYLRYWTPRESSESVVDTCNFLLAEATYVAVRLRTQGFRDLFDAMPRTAFQLRRLLCELGRRDEPSDRITDAKYPITLQDLATFQMALDENLFFRADVWTKLLEMDETRVEIDDMIRSAAEELACVLVWDGDGGGGGGDIGTALAASTSDGHVAPPLPPPLAPAAFVEDGIGRSLDVKARDSLAELHRLVVATANQQ